jgi:putative nucleotidyltransferase with HDIG domain
MKARSAYLHIPIFVAALVGTGLGRAQQYSFRVYGLDQGLTNLGVKNLYQDKQGFLWVSTENGIFRYDGDRFQWFGDKEGIPPSSGIAFGEAPDGSLLVGGEIGLLHKVGGRFERVAMPKAKHVSWSSGIQSDGKGATWVTTEAGLMRITRKPGGPGFTFYLLPKPPGVERATSIGLLVENDTIWYGCDKQLCQLASGHVKVYGEGEGLPSGRWRSIRRAGNGDLWALGGARVALLRSGGTRFEVAQSPFHTTGVTGILNVDSAGRVLFGTTDGLLLRDGNTWKRVGRGSGLRGPAYCSLEDREGSLWIGLPGGGLERWAGYQDWEAFNSGSGLESELVYQVLPLPDGSVWAATEGGLFRGVKTDSVWTWRKQQQLSGISIHSIQRDRAGALWLGTESKGAARFNPSTGQLEWFTEKQGLNGQNPFILALDSRNRIWAATESGLFVADLAAPRFHLVEQVPKIQTWTVLEAPDGAIWVGSDHGLFRLSGGVWTHITAADGLSHEVALTLAAAKNGDVWVGYRYGGGLDHIRMTRGKPEILHPANNPGGKPATVYFLGFDSGERLWAGTDRGVDVWDGHSWSHYDSRDGLIWDDCNLNGFAAAPDGSVWIGTSGGLAHFTPRPVVSRIYPPNPIYTRLILGNQEVDPQTEPAVEHASNRLRARFSALTFAREGSLSFRYRLTPLFEEWHETQQRELQFDGLQPGQYRLEVLARDGWGRWSTQPAAFSFRILAPWWRPWVLPILLSVPVAIVALVSRLRGAALRRREQALVRIVEERTAELKQAHLDLLQLARLEHEKRLADEHRAHAEQVAQLNRRAIQTLALAIEAKDQTTAQHLQRVETYAIGVATEMGLDETQLEALRAAALLHDVGKVAVPEYIISKPGRLTPDEFEKMKTHTVVGAEIVEQIGFPYPVAPIVRSHHEKWNGSGYPDGLSGVAIPIGARILAAVDCLDALASDRQYRRALPLDEAIRVVQSEAGKSYDPAVVEVLARRYIELEGKATSKGVIETTKLSTNLKITRGAAPAAGFEVTAPSVSTSADLRNLHHSLTGADQANLGLANLAQDIASSGDRAEIYTALRQLLPGVAPYDAMALYLCRDDRLVPESWEGEDYAKFLSVEIPIGAGLSGWVAEHRKPSVNGNPAVEPGYQKDPARFGLLRSALSVPLETREELVGVLSLYRTERDAFSPEHLARLLSLARTLAPALNLSMDRVPNGR